MSTIKSKENAAYAVQSDDLVPLVNNVGDTPQSVNPLQLAIAAAINGDKYLTVGVNGRFATITEALDYIALQPTMTLITTSAHLELTQWDHFIPLTNPGTDTLGDAQPGDFVYITGDDPGVDIYQYDWHYYRVYSAIENNLESNPGILIESGILGPSQTNVLAEIRRPSEFVIQLLDGDFDTTGATMPDGYSVKIQGLGRTTTVSGSGIAMPIYGHTEFTNFIQTDNLTTSDTRTVDVGNDLLDAGFSSLHMHDMWCEGEDVNIAGDMVWQSLRIKNLDLSGFKGHRIYFMMMADYMEIENVRYDTVSSMELVEIFTHARRQSSSWTKIVRNCKFRRSEDVSAQSASSRGNLIFGVDLPESNMPEYRMDFYNCIIEDNGLKTQAHNNQLCQFQVFDDASNKAFIRFIDCELNNIDSHDFDLGIESGIVGTSMFIELINTYNYDVIGKVRNQLTDNFPVSSANIYYRHKDSYLDFTFITFMVPNMSQSEAIIHTPITGNLTMLNPTGGVKGQTKKLVFEQDGTGGYTITWSGTEYRIHSNPIGTAGQKAVFDLYYDGTDWIQIGATGWA